MADASSTPAAPASNWKSRIKVVAILAVIVLAQCGVAYVYLPSSSQATASEAVAESAATPVPTIPAAPEATDREVDLGVFSIAAINTTSNTTLMIDFHLYGTVAHEPVVVVEGEEPPAPPKEGEAAPNDSKFGKLYERHKHRFRDQVIMIIRNAQVADLSDPGLGLIKRQILAKTNAMLGEPLVKEVIFSEFAVIEQ